jgi:hypothetical protein
MKLARAIFDALLVMLAFGLVAEVLVIIERGVR